MDIIKTKPIKFEAFDSSTTSFDINNAIDKTTNNVIDLCAQYGFKTNTIDITKMTVKEVYKRSLFLTIFKLNEVKDYYGKDEKEIINDNTLFTDMLNKFIEKKKSEYYIRDILQHYYSVYFCLIKNSIKLVDIIDDGSVIASVIISNKVKNNNTYYTRKSNFIVDNEHIGVTFTSTKLSTVLSNILSPNNTDKNFKEKISTIVKKSKINFFTNRDTLNHDICKRNINPTNVVTSKFSTISKELSYIKSFIPSNKSKGISLSPISNTLYLLKTLFSEEKYAETVNNTATKMETSIEIVETIEKIAATYFGENNYVKLDTVNNIIECEYIPKSTVYSFKFNQFYVSKNENNKSILLITSNDEYNKRTLKYDVATNKTLGTFNVQLVLNIKCLLNKQITIDLNNLIKDLYNNMPINESIRSTNVQNINSIQRGIQGVITDISKDKTLILPKNKIITMQTKDDQSYWYHVSSICSILNELDNKTYSKRFYDNYLIHSTEFVDYRNTSYSCTDKAMQTIAEFKFDCNNKNLKEMKELFETSKFNKTFNIYNKHIVYSDIDNDI
jgi:ribosome-associated protein YbcJ (S4-like RNA binding protein)